MTSDNQIMCALIHQVASATASRIGPGSERDVTTYITRPLWDRWCHAVGSPVPSKPTAWLGIHETLRVYGSETIVIENVDAQFAVSIPSVTGIPMTIPARS